MTINSADIKYLVFSGGGAAGVAFSGAVKQLGKTPGFSLKQIEGVAGTSVGALLALGVALNYSADELSEKIDTLNLTQFEEGGSLPDELHRVYSKLGWYSGKALYDYILSLIKEKTHREDPENITFADLHEMGFKDLHIITTKLFRVNDASIGKEKVFCYETSPDTSVAAAVLASISVPFYFPYVRMKKAGPGKYVLTEDKDGQVYCDGGLTNNYAIQRFDQRKYFDPDSDNGEDHAINPHTLGLVLRNRSGIIAPSHQVKTPIADDHPLEMVEGVLNVIANKFENESLTKKENIERSIEIDRLGVSLGQFNMSSKTRAALVQSGEAAVRQGFDEKQEATVSHNHAMGMWHKVSVEKQEVKTQKDKRCVLM